MLIIALTQPLIINNVQLVSKIKGSVLSELPDNNDRSF